MVWKWYDQVALLAVSITSRLLPLRTLAMAAVLVPTLALPVLAQGERYFGVRAFGPWGWGLGLMLLIRGLLVVALVVVVWRILSSRTSTPRLDPAVQLLRERYARGEISEDEYRNHVATLK